MKKNKNKNYYTPNYYNSYRNYSKANAPEEQETEEDYSVANADVLIMEIEKESRRHDKTKPPQPPINARKKPKAVDVKKAHHSVYDEIAERHKKQAETFQNFNTTKENKPEPKEIFSNAPVQNSDEFDVIQGYEVQKKKHTGLWIALIVLLSVMCLAAAAVYAYLAGCLDFLF